MGEVLSNLFVDPAFPEFTLVHANNTDGCNLVSDHYVVMNASGNYSLCNTGGDIPQGGYGDFQCVFLGMVYAAILFYASNMISEGSEKLLLIPSLKNLVGSVVLPILGAVPDGAIVLFSGMGPKAQEELTVGVGALAGSTIMLLTLPYSLAIIFGRVEIINGKASYRKPRNPLGKLTLFGHGVSVKDDSIKLGGYAMIFTMVSFLIIQIPALVFTGGKSQYSNETAAAYKQETDGEHIWALIGLVVSVLCFGGYLYYNVVAAGTGEEWKRILLRQIKNREIDLYTLFNLNENLNGTDGLPNVNTPLNNRIAETVRFVLDHFFDKYDKDHDGTIDLAELGKMLDDMNFRQIRVKEALEFLDKNHDSLVNKHEFRSGMQAVLTQFGKVIHKREERRKTMAFDPEYQMKAVTNGSSEEESNADYDEVDDDEGEENEELKNMTESEILMLSFKEMLIGTLIVLLFSDPMVAILSSIGARTGIPSFYIAFIFAPLASNASELIAAINYAGKKTKSSLQIALQLQQGAACMNNTFCLAIFFALIAFQGLAWQFTAETISIVFVESVLFLYSFKTTYTVFDAFCIMSLFPISIALVAILELKGGLALN